MRDTELTIFMILQKTVFPCAFAKDAEELYFRADDNVKNDGEKLVFSAGGTCAFDTYTAVFSLDKWTRYAFVGEVFLSVKAKGKFLLSIFRRFYDAQGGNAQKDERCYFAEFTDETTVSLPKGEGICYFVLNAKTDGEFYGAEFFTEKPCENEVKLCAIICTYKREEFVKKNLKTLKERLIDDKDNALYGKFKVIVADNGQTLDPNAFNSDEITIFPNKNAGGAGGFTRGIMEAKKLERQGFTHIVLCDDDVVFDAESFLRVFSILSYVKPEYKDVFIGGAMLRTDDASIQNERADRWDYARGKVVPIGHILDLSDGKNLLENESEEEINYLSWWFCAMPITVPTDENLPLPLFIKRDDIEYGLRNGKHFMTLNGIFVWHEPFETKRPAFLEYYYNRNQCIMESIHKKDFNAKTLKKRMLKETLRGILTFRYNEAKAAIKGAEDFLRGIEWLKKIDPTALNAEIMKYNAISVNLTNTDSFDEYEKLKKWSVKKKIAACLTFNGWLIPSKKVITVPSVRPSYKAFFGVKEAINYDEKTGKGYATKRSAKEAKNCLKALLLLIKEINKNFDAAKEEYRTRYSEITNLGFWKEYLGITETGNRE